MSIYFHHKVLVGIALCLLSSLICKGSPPHHMSILKSFFCLPFHYLAKSGLSLSGLSGMWVWYCSVAVRRCFRHGFSVVRKELTGHWKHCLFSSPAECSCWPWLQDDWSRFPHSLCTYLLLLMPWLWQVTSCDEHCYSHEFNWLLLFKWYESSCHAVWNDCDSLPA